MGRLVEWALVLTLISRLSFGRWPWHGAGWGMIRAALGFPRREVAADDLARARTLLALDAGADRAAIIEAHRRLMICAHPDKGGANTTAQAANAARDLLLANLAGKA